MALLSLDLAAFEKGMLVKISFDGSPSVSYEVKKNNEIIYLKKETDWQLTVTPALSQKGIHRNGTFKDGFRHQMVFVYSTGGNKEEAGWAFEKAKYDAETWYYRGNGAVDIVSDKDFRPENYADRSVVLYGNKYSNLAWNKLLASCPVTVENGKISIGEKHCVGDDLAAYFVWPRQDSDIASVAVISGTVKKGFLAANANQYFSGGSGFPDLMIFSLDMLKNGIKEVKMAGFFGNDWSVEKGEFVTN